METDDEDAAEKPPKLSQAQEEVEFLRRYALAGAFSARGPVEIDGVTFDFTYDLDKTLWRPDCPLGLYGAPTIRFAPRIAFPWTPPEILEVWRAAGEVVEAPAGSTVRIAVVRSVPINPTYGDLDLEEHRERKLVYLWVVRPGHDLRVADPPMMLLAKTATVAHIELEDYSHAFNGLVTRLERLLATEDLEDTFHGPASDWPPIPLELSPTHRRALLALHKAFVEVDEHAYAAFGYLMGRAEAEAQLLPQALREHQAAQHRAKGGRRKSELSRLETEPLRAAAKRVIREDSQTSLTACARAVGGLFATDPDWKMSTETKWISDSIKELFEQREIGGKLEYRPRPEWTA